MHEEDNCEYCYGPRHASGCGWLLICLVAAFVVIIFAAAVYHEVNFHPDPDPVMDSTLFDHFRLPDNVEKQAADSAYFDSLQKRSQ